MIALVVVLHLVVFETLDGRNVYVNPSHVVSVSETSEDRDPNEKLFTKKVHCVITLTNGVKITLADDCDAVKQRLEERQ